MTRKIALGVTTAATVFVLITVAGLIVLLRTPPVDSTADQTLEQGTVLEAGPESAQRLQMRYDEQLGETDLLLARLQSQIALLAGQLEAPSEFGATYPAADVLSIASEPRTDGEPRQIGGQQLDDVSRVLADSLAQITGLRAWVDSTNVLDSVVGPVPAIEDTGAAWAERESAYQRQIELANAMLAQSYDAETVGQMEEAYAQLVSDANAQLSDAFNQLQALQDALRQVRDQNALLLEREDTYQRQLEEADRLLNSPVLTKQSEQETPGYETTYVDDEDDDGSQSRDQSRSRDQSQSRDRDQSQSRG